MRGYVALGSNLGDREGSLRAGLAGMGRRGLAARALSSVWETEPVDSPQPLLFLNMVAEVETDLSPRRVLEMLLEVEREVGRVRSVRNAPRALDLDLLLLWRPPGAGGRPAPAPTLGCGRAASCWRRCTSWRRGCAIPSAEGR
jgi:2-amino-4-hydroxy-6-hydroxymethyldihydropteridine diphosphokinase